MSKYSTCTCNWREVVLPFYLWLGVLSKQFQFGNRPCQNKSRQNQGAPKFIDRAVPCSVVCGFLLVPGTDAPLQVPEWSVGDDRRLAPYIYQNNSSQVSSTGSFSPQYKYLCHPPTHLPHCHCHSIPCRVVPNARLLPAPKSPHRPPRVQLAVQVQVL